MNKESITVSSVLTLNGYNLPALLVWCLCIGKLTSRIESLLWTLVIYLALVVVSALVSLFVYAFVFMDQVTLSIDGIVRKNRLRTKSTHWNQIAQAGFMQDKHPSVLVLVEEGGSMRKNPDSNLFFYLRNTGKLIAIPDEPGVLDLVTRHYGPLDFDLSGESESQLS